MTAHPMSMQEALAGLINQHAARYERTIYYRTPPKLATGRAHKQAGWIAMAGSNENTTMRMIKRGFEPLYQFGPIPTEPGPGGSWGPILRHPDGPAQFPLEQVKAYFWFLPENVPVPGVRFPCLRGIDPATGKPVTIKVRRCIECEHRMFLQANHLARHLKNSHGYDRAALIALGNDMGVSFSADLVGGNIETELTFEDEADSATAPIEEPDFVLETETPSATRRRAAVPA